MLKQLPIPAVEQLCFVVFLTQAGKAVTHCNELRYTTVVVSMAPHLSGKEQDQLMEWRRKGCTPRLEVPHGVWAGYGYKLATLNVLCMVCAV